MPGPAVKRVGGRVRREAVQELPPVVRLEVVIYAVKIDRWLRHVRDRDENAKPENGVPTPARRIKGRGRRTPRPGGGHGVTRAVRLRVAPAVFPCSKLRAAMGHERGYRRNNTERGEQDRPFPEEAVSGFYRCVRCGFHSFLLLPDYRTKSCSCKVHFVRGDCRPQDRRRTVDRTVTASRLH